MRTTTTSKVKRTNSKPASGLTLSDAFGRAKRNHARYIELARASERLGDHVATEGLYQQAEHYIRLLTSTAHEPRR